MPQELTPKNSDDVLDAVQWAVASKTPLHLRGGGSKEALGRPPDADTLLDLSGLQGITLFEPDELVLSAGAATPMAEIELLLSEHRQSLAFEPPDWGPLLGRPAGQQTLGGVLACNLAGARRIKAGAARDHFLGLQGVTGRGEEVKSGGRVVKNVTGYDLCKLTAGSYGTLLAMTAVTVKVLPAPEKTRTVLLYGLDLHQAVAALAAAGGSPHEVSGLAYLPRNVAARSNVSYVRDAGASVVAIRVEGPAPSVEHRGAALRRQFSSGGETEELHFKNSQSLWRQIGDVAPLLPLAWPAIWKLSVTPGRMPDILTAIKTKLAVEYYADWAGGLVWLAVEKPSSGAEADHPEGIAMEQIIRRAIGSDGHATLIRADADLRRTRAVFQPQPAPLAALTRRVKESFDPLHLLNPGKLYPES